ncbi:hypothetical protein CYMTET_25388 [Cymbomonas tetramitiformis]|uniref:Uncharacterized protein n=1 Tax=Cymbomonas tetramitiformis TaxID=36881 RepID=A0AAE0FUJ0_9CHLO|nr:hypothetical protein CYMTET_25388 [Cymbomonas tetramitiformis]
MRSQQTVFTALKVCTEFTSRATGRGNQKKCVKGQPATTATYFSRRDFGTQTLSTVALWSSLCAPPAEASLSAFERAFYQAMEAGSTTKADEAWSRAINLSPENAAAWSNRGTLRLQLGRWEDANTDLQFAKELELRQNGEANSLLLNNLGNTQGAIGEWDRAIENYLSASKDPSMSEIALANYALALFQIGESEAGLKEAQSLVRKDPNFWDMRAAVTAFLWGAGQEAAAEASWEDLKACGDGLGAALYSSVDRVKGRWPPRATAALAAFLALERTGEAMDYDGEVKTYSFN